MRRFLRGVFNIAAFSSALIFLLIAALWVRSYFVGDRWIWYEPDCDFCCNLFCLGRGYARYAWGDMSRLSGTNLPAGYYREGASDLGDPAGLRVGTTHFVFAGLRFSRIKDDFLLAQANLIWPLAISAILPALWVIQKRRQRRRAQAGLCRVCGYDLRASPARCPECGNLPPARNLQADSSLSAAIADIMSQSKT